MKILIGVLGGGLLVSALFFFLNTQDPGEGRLPGVTWHDEVIKVASGNAYRGPWRMNESEFDFVDDPTVTVDSNGNIGVAWADHSRKDIFFQRYTPEGQPQLEPPVNVSLSPRTFSWLPRIVVTDDDAATIHVLWQEIVFSGGSHGGEIFYSRSNDGGRSFDKPLNLSNTMAGAGKGRLSERYWHNGSLDIVADPEGRLYAAWTEYEGPLRFSRSTDGGATWSSPLRIAGGLHELPARGPSIAVDTDNVYIAWTVGEDARANINLIRSNDGGRTFDKPVTASPGGGHSDAPKIAIDAQGGLHLVYAVSPGGPSQRYHIRHTRSMDGGRTFAEPRRISGRPTDHVDSSGFPSMHADGNDHIFVTWELFPRREGRPQGLGIAVSADGGATFSRPSIVPGSADPGLGFNGSQQGLLMRKLSVSPTGRIAVVNSSFNPNQESRIHLWIGQREQP